VSLASINERTTLDDTEEDDDIPQPETSLSATTSPSTNYPPRQPAWGFSKSSRRSLTLSNSPKKPITSSKRRNSVDQDPRLSNQRTHTESTPRPRSTQSLGSGESHSNTFPSASCSAGKPIGKEALTNHNEVEKKYRNRLNDQFETLAQKLPNEVGDGKGEKRVSKAEVLIHAKTHIRELEKGKKALEDEKLELEETVKKLKRKWIRLGGICMP
jgi:hypothetical protein